MRIVIYEMLKKRKAIVCGIVVNGIDAIRIKGLSLHHRDEVSYEARRVVKGCNNSNGKRHRKRGLSRVRRVGDHIALTPE